jgi:hypothetical protein
MAATDPTLLNSAPTMLQQSITQLSITLRLPLEFFQSLEALGDNHTVSPDKTEQALTTAKTWIQISAALGRLSTLARLRLWFDHSDPRTWSLVNERMLLSPLLTQLSSTRINVSIILPTLHPQYEHEDRHLITKLPGRSIQLCRNLRQEFYLQETSQGGIEVVEKSDFPFFRDFFDMPMAEIEAWERKGWDQGRDMEAEYLAEADRLWGSHGNI